MRLDVGPDDAMRPLELRVVALETWVSTTEKIAELQKASSLREAALIDQRLSKIEGYLSKLIWILLGGFIASGVTFIVNGGLTLGQ